MINVSFLFRGAARRLVRVQVNEINNGEGLMVGCHGNGASLNSLIIFAKDLFILYNLSFVGSKREYLQLQSH